MMSVPAFSADESVQLLPSSPGFRSAGILATVFPGISFRLWATLYDCLTNPLWFPLACFALIPIATFLMLADGLSDGGGDEEEEEDVPVNRRCSYVQVRILVKHDDKNYETNFL